jgi:hypothetical protein
MFGARITRGECKIIRHLIASDIHTLHHEPRLTMYASIPQKWLNQWFQRCTWVDGNFDRLHRAGKLLAPSPDRSVKQFSVLRYWNTQKSGVTRNYRAGRLTYKPCCDDESWYLDILERDQELSRTHGVDTLQGWTRGTMTM